MDKLIQRFENGEWLNDEEIQALATELGGWVIEANAQDQAEEAEHLALMA